MAQPVLALGDLGRAAADVAQRQARQQREAAERDRHERQHGRDDARAGAVRHPGKPRDRLVEAVGHREDMLVRMDRLGTDDAQVGKVEARADVGEELAVDVLHGEQQRDGIARHGAARQVGGHAGNDRGAAHEDLQPLRAARAGKIGRRVGRGFEHDLVLARLRAAAQQVDDAVKLGPRRIEARGHDAGIVQHRVGQLVGAVGDEDMLVVEEGGEPQSDQMMHPVRIEIVVQLQDDIVGCCDVFELAQHAAAAIDDGVGEELALLDQLDVVGALRGGQHRDDDANDRHDDDKADRRGADAARALSFTPIAELSSFAQSPSPHGDPPGH